MASFFYISIIHIYSSKSHKHYCPPFAIQKSIKIIRSGSAYLTTAAIASVLQEIEYATVCYTPELPIRQTACKHRVDLSRNCFKKSPCNAFCYIYIKSGDMIFLFIIKCNQLLLYSNPCSTCFQWQALDTPAVGILGYLRH